MKLTKSILAGVLSLSLAVPALANTQAPQAAPQSQPTLEQQADAICGIVALGTMDLAIMHQTSKPKTDAQKHVDDMQKDLKQVLGFEEGFADNVAKFWREDLERFYATKPLATEKEQQQAVQGVAQETYQGCVYGFLNAAAQK